jgi:hypothetical protein
MVPTNAIIRVRGFVVGGYCSGSSWFVQTMLANHPGSDLQTALGGTVAAVGTAGCVPIRLESGGSLTNLMFTVEVREPRFTNFVVQPTALEVGTAVVLSQNATSAVVLITSAPGQALRGPATLANLCFQVLPAQPSAFVPLEIVNMIATRTDGRQVGLPEGLPGRVVVVGEQLLLAATLETNAQAAVVLYALPGTTNTLETTTNLNSPIVWSVHTQVTTTNLFHTSHLNPTNSERLFFRARREQ